MVQTTIDKTALDQGHAIKQDEILIYDDTHHALFTRSAVVDELPPLSDTAIPK